MSKASAKSSKFVCPDCTGTAVGNELVHDDGCPLSLGVDTATAADRDWFVAHPNADEYHRPITAGEIAELRMAGHNDPTWALPDRVYVLKLGGPGLRSRYFYRSPRREREIAERLSGGDDHA